MSNTNNKLTKADFTTDKEVRWCPGCGDYAILASMQRVLPTIGISPDKIVFVSGIGCDSLFPYYMNTYGFHTIHGRALPIATGIALTNPELTVFVVTGDGDSLSIGLNHLIHTMRRNVNLNILLVNNNIYGLTKGQFSPTSTIGQKTKTSPTGVKDKPLNSISMALAADCSFVARTFDVDATNLQSIIKQAVAHQGTSFIEVLQNCNVFNDGAFAEFTDKKNRPERIINIEPMQPLIFGSENNKALCINEMKMGITEDLDAALVHNPYSEASFVPDLLAKLDYNKFPMPMGIFRSIARKTFEEQFSLVSHEMTEEQLLLMGETWERN